MDYVRAAREIQPMQPDSHVTKRKARKAATLPVAPTGAAGWRRFNAPAPALSTGVDQVVFFASNAVSPSDEVLLRHYQRQLAAQARPPCKACSALADAHGYSQPTVP